MKHPLRKPVRRVRTKREYAPTRSAIARHFTAYPVIGLPFKVRVYISPTRRHMQKAAEFITGFPDPEDFHGMVRHYMSKVTGRYVVRPRHVVADMFLNASDLRHNANEIIAHECGHAGMAWARLCKANLSTMDGEEVLCYAIGVLHKQIIGFGYGMGIWK
ncbi:MAG TPA: hypothetical protein VF800_02540 [Telluria sp.]|jgi:hypothetical protein